MEPNYFSRPQPRSSTPSPTNSPSEPAEISFGVAVTIVILFALYLLFQITLICLIIKNKIQRRRRQKKLIMSSGYNPLGSDLELGVVPRSGLSQVPTNKDGSVGLVVNQKPKLDILYQRDTQDQLHTLSTLPYTEASSKDAPDSQSSPSANAQQPYKLYGNEHITTPNTIPKLPAAVAHPR